METLEPSESSELSASSSTPESLEQFGHPIVILNPTANRGNMKHHQALIRQHLEQTHGEYAETTRKGEAQEFAYRAAQEGRPVVMIGGDGTLHEVANGILSSGKRVPLGIIAAGSGNDFAWNTLKLPRDPAKAVEIAFNGKLVDADAGIVNGKYFVNSFSIGIDADIAVAAGWMKKIPLMSGERLYYSTTIKQLLFGYQRCPWLRFRLDDNEEPTQATTMHRYVLIAVTNGPTYGAGFRINPTAVYDDGLLDICTITHAPLPRALKVLPVVQRGEHDGLPEVTFYRAKSIHIQSKNPVNIQMDGETTSATSFDAKILPGALWVRVQGT